MAKISALVLILVLGFEASAQLIPDGRAGFSKVEIRTPKGIALAGYGGGARRNWGIPQNPWHLLLSPSHGVHDPVASKALVVSKGKKKLALVSLDLVATSNKLRREVANNLSDLGFTESEIILTSTHTHSGPGLWAHEFLWEVIAADFFNPLFFRSLVEDVSRSIREAHQKSQPAIFGYTQAPLIGSTRNRRLNVDFPVVATLLSFKDLRGKAIATLLNFPIHGTLMGLSNRMMTGDIPAEIERQFEKASGSPTLFVNGAEGDVSPIYNGANFQEMERRAAVIASKLLPFWRLILHGPLRTLDFDEGDFDLGPTQINILACVDKKLPGLLSLKSPLPLRTSTRVGWVKFNEHLALWVPGEATAAVGLELEVLGRQKAKPLTTSIFGLANDHISYIVTAEEYLAGGYEACSSLYGRNVSDELKGAFDRLLSLSF